MTPQDTFITRLRRHRERKRISIEEIIATTRIKRELIAAFERGDLSAWPRGLYARAWVRGYASAIGLDPIDTVDEFCRLFPHGDRRTGGTVQEMAAIVAHDSEYRDEFSHPERRRVSPRVNMMGKPGWNDVLQMALNGWPKLAALFAPYVARPTRRRGEI